jgi:hypothetical protein
VGESLLSLIEGKVKSFQICQELKGFLSIWNALAIVQGTRYGRGFEALSQEELSCGREEDIERKENLANLYFLGSK